MSRERERFDEIGKKIKRDIDASFHQQLGRRRQHMLGLPGGTLNTITPCAACKLLRRRCAQECPFSPYFSPHEPQKFASVHKVFGASNVSKLLMEVPENQRADAANSLVYEANVRLRDPVYGCMGAISSLQHQVQSLQAELNAVRAEILRYKYSETTHHHDQHQHQNHHHNNIIPSTHHLALFSSGGTKGGGGGASSEEEEQNQLSLVALLIAALRKSMVACRVDQRDDQIQSSGATGLHQMEIGWPTNVQHLTHVTFDRFHGFLGLPVEFEVEIPCRVPSASVSVFGVSAESMQCSYDSRGNSVPTILLLMQERLYAQGGLKAEGIFRINAENSKEEEVRDQLNRGMVPEDIEVHCLAGLIKAWFRELPCGVLDGLSPEEVLQCNTEEECSELVKHLKPTETALLNWAVDLMTDVVEHEESNKMNARNIAMVFAPNMTQMSDPLTALMHAVQVMNLLKTLITKTLREREECATTDGGCSPMSYRSDRQSDDSQEEMETSCELIRQQPPSSEDEEDENENYEDEVESLSEMEESFLKQLIENENAKDCFKKELGNLVKRSSPTSGFEFQEESSVMTDGYGSGVSVSPEIGTEVEMVNKIVECVK